MAHQPGWIELYERIDEGRPLDRELVELCKGSQTGIGETMLHWYAIEGEAHALTKLIELGFDVNARNHFGNTPIMECALIGRWDNATALLEGGADLSIKNDDGENFMEYLEAHGVRPPDDFIQS